jgi:deleted-in-malignant-brain-tumors protein 1
LKFVTSEKKVRLVGGPDSHEGRVEVFYEGEWGSICDDKWNLRDGHVICRMLGFGLAVSVSCCSQYGISDSQKIWMDDVRCKGHERSIMSCAHRKWGEHNCNSKETAGLVCREPKKTAGEWLLFIFISV